MSRYNKNTWGMSKYDQPSGSMNGQPRRNPCFGRKDFTGLSRVQEDEQETEGPPLEDNTPPDPMIQRLDRILEKVDRMELRMDNTDRRIEKLEPDVNPDPDPPYDDEDFDDVDLGPPRRNGYFDRVHRPRNPNPGFRDRGMDKHPRRRGYPNDDPGAFPHRGDRPRHQEHQLPTGAPRAATCWDPPGLHHDNTLRTYDQRTHHQTSC